MCGQMDICVDMIMKGWMDGWMLGKMDQMDVRNIGQVDVWMDRWTLVDIWTEMDR